MDIGGSPPTPPDTPQCGTAFGDQSASRLSRVLAESCSKPRQLITGRRGYFGNVGAVSGEAPDEVAASDRPQRQKVEFRADVTGRA